MKILLDTHTFLWAISDNPYMSKAACKFFLNPKNDLYLSIASTWEIAIKTSLGKLEITQPLKEFIPEQLKLNCIALLPIQFDHVIKVASLPFHHRDPFDRLLIAQAKCEKLNLLSNDKAFDDYEIERLW